MRAQLPVPTRIDRDLSDGIRAVGQFPAQLTLKNLQLDREFGQSLDGGSGRWSAVMKEATLSAAPAATVPVVWSVLGYNFPAGSMFVGLLTCLMVRLFITLDSPAPKRWLLDGIVTGLAMLITAVWIVEHQVDLFAALGTGGMTGAVGAGIISFFKRRGQNAIDALDAALPGKPAIPSEMKAVLREIDKAP